MSLLLKSSTLQAKGLRSRQSRDVRVVSSFIIVLFKAEYSGTSVNGISPFNSTAMLLGYTQLAAQGPEHRSSFTLQTT